MAGVGTVCLCASAEPLGTKRRGPGESLLFPMAAGLAEFVLLHLSAQLDRCSYLRPSRSLTSKPIAGLTLPVVFTSLYAGCKLATQGAMSFLPCKRLCMAIKAADPAIFSHAPWLHSDKMRCFPVAGLYHEESVLPGLLPSGHF